MVYSRGENGSTQEEVRREGGGLPRGWSLQMTEEGGLCKKGGPERVPRGQKGGLKGGGPEEDPRGLFLQEDREGRLHKTTKRVIFAKRPRWSSLQRGDPREIKRGGPARLRLREVVVQGIKEKG